MPTHSSLRLVLTKAYIRIFMYGDNPIVTTNWSGTLKSGSQRQPHSASLTSIIMQRKWLFILGLFGSYVKKSLLMPFQTIIVIWPNNYRAGFDLVKWEYEIEADKPGLAVDKALFTLEPALTASIGLGK